ncbi:MAG: hypothetical protein U9P71_00480 [Campylobacterota bacterium]|nr:hypothetical protein [Campylobacterota bacterium]
MKEIEALQATRYLEKDELQSHLEGVEYIMMAQPSLRDDSPAPVHFTIFLNTQEALPNEVITPVFEKFCKQYNIFDVIDLISGIGVVAFSVTQQKTPMPMHLFKQEEMKEMPNTKMYIFDFEADATEFKEAKDGLTGWTYSYSE